MRYKPTVFISGANRGIGFELAKRYAEKDYRVFAGCRNPNSAKEVSKFAEVIPLDVTSLASCAALQSQIASNKIDILINNAGIIGPSLQSTEAMDFSGFIETLEINTLGPLRLTQALLPFLKNCSKAKVVTLTSNMGTMSYAKSDHVAYRASKAAANKVMQCLATDLKPFGIAVAALHPGWVRTEMGGAGADISPLESSAGLCEVIDALSLETSGRFWSYDGKILPW